MRRCLITTAPPQLEFPSFLTGCEYIQIGDGFRALSGMRLNCISGYAGDIFNPILIIGKNVSFQHNCHIGCINKIVIGDNCLFGSNVLIMDHSHGNSSIHENEIPPAKRSLYSKGTIIIEDNVWVADSVCILPNVKIGKNSIIGAGAIVTHDIPANSIAVGNPAKVIKQLL